MEGFGGIDGARKLVAEHMWRHGITIVARLLSVTSIAAMLIGASVATRACTGTPPSCGADTTPNAGGLDQNIWGLILG